MTTIVRTRNPLEALSMSQQPQSRRRSKRLAAYDEADGDFSFARVTKKTKTAPAESDAARPAQAALPKRSKQKPEREHEAPTETKKTSRRKMTFHTPKAEKEEVKVAKRGTRKSTRSSIGKGQNGESSMNGSGMETDYDSIDMVGAPAADETSKSMVEVKYEQSTMIQLPFGDTPVINRNKELRKKGAGARRSSLGLRGRRASSLIDNGHSALPHREVASNEFYKHIEAEGLSEPRRMKQLLTWTGERALGEKPSHGDPNNTARHAARMINEALLKEFATKSEFSDWFSREESTTPPTKIVKTLNPRNTEYAEKIAELEPRIKRLQEERDQWKALAKPPPPLPPLFGQYSEPLAVPQIDTSLLDPEQAAILSGLGLSALEISNQTSERLKTLQSGLEFKIDQFADGVHKVEQYRETASRVADKILAVSAVRLEERDRREKEEIGTRDVPMQEVLRSLSRILPDGGNGR